MSKKVLQCFTMSPNAFLGGVAAIVNSYLKRKDDFSACGHEIDLFNYHSERVDRLPHSMLRNLAYIPAQQRALRRQLKEQPVDIVHIHTSREFLFLKDMLLARMIRRKTSSRVVMTIHVGALSTVFNRIPKALHRRLIRWMGQYIDEVIFLSRAMEKEFRDAGFTGRSRVLYNFHLLEETSAPQRQDDTLRLMFVGSIQPEKGVTELFGAMEQVSDIPCHLDLCGTITHAPSRELYEGFISRLGERITAHGYVSGEAKTKLFEAADVLVLPSYHEGLPVVILEALASGCAIISTPVGATPEILTEENAIWVQVKSADEVAQAIRRLHDDRELLHRMQRANREYAAQFSCRAHIGQLCRIYDDAAANG